MPHQYILGINGLGISPSACITKNGEIIAMAEEERFVRIKNAHGLMPAKAVEYCIKEAGISLKDISKIIFAWDCNFYKYKIYWFLIIQFIKRFFELGSSSSNLLRIFQEIIKYNPSQVRNQIREMLREEGFSEDIPPIQFVSHHLAHAASTFYASSFDKADIIVIDGSGENISTSIWQGIGNRIIPVKNYYIPDSLGWFYQTMTEYLGFTPNSHEGKVMALAAYGKYNKDVEKKLAKLLDIQANGNYKFNSKYSFSGKKDKGIVFSSLLEDLLGPCRKQNTEITQYHKDIAFHTQSLLEDAVINLVQDISNRQNFSGNICIAGGVGLNCKMNGKIASLDCVKNIYVPPFSSDIGTSYGAAASLLVQRKTPITHAYWGPRFSNEEIETILKRYNIPYQKIPNIAEATAQLLSENKIIAWFQGRMEVGARALGARSIIANPKIEKNRDFINQNIKNREIWRPFATSILDENKHDFIDTHIDSPFMTIAFEVKESAKKKIPAAIHIDNTTRPQFVKKETHSLYWELIKKFGDKTGVYAVLNTSFNLREEPIVCTPEQAVRTFFTSALDALAIGDFLIVKSE